MYDLIIYKRCFGDPDAASDMDRGAEPVNWGRGHTMSTSSNAGSVFSDAGSDAMGGALTDAGVGVGGAGGGAVDLSGGDAVVLTAAVLYSAFTIRLGTYARELNAADLSAVKSLVMAVLCIMWVLLEQV